MLAYVFGLAIVGLVAFLLSIWPKTLRVHGDMNMLDLLRARLAVKGSVRFGMNERTYREIVSENPSKADVISSLPIVLDPRIKDGLVKELKG